MGRRDIETAVVRQGAGRDGFVSLLRKPAVQVILTLAAVGQFAAVQQGPRQDTAPVATLAPVVVESAVDDAVAGNGEVEADALRLAADLRGEGYPVTGDLAEQITEAAETNGIDLDVAFGLVRAESSFRNVATSRVGAIGLTQLMPSTARWLEPGVTRTELRNPETNLRIGFRYLKDLIEKYEGDVDLALTAYNRGPGTVDRALKRGRNPDNGYADFVRTGKRGRHKG